MPETIDFEGLRDTGEGWIDCANRWRKRALVAEGILTWAMKGLRCGVTEQPAEVCGCAFCRELRGLVEGIRANGAEQR